jgi:micrococcal nuclease
MKPFYRLPLKPIRFFGGLILLVLSTLAADAAESAWVRIKWVVDGDTIILQDGRHVRYIGIDTPEIGHKNQRAEPMADLARSTNRQIVEGWRLRLVFDQEQTDRYGRTLAYVYRSDGVLVNAELVKNGCAHVLYEWPNTSKAQVLLSVQREAMRVGLGIWRDVERDEKPLAPYRGNRSSKRFHAHDCPMGKTMAKKNQIWLKNQWAAFWEGYAPARECIDFP